MRCQQSYEGGGGKAGKEKGKKGGLGARILSRKEGNRERGTLCGHRVEHEGPDQDHARE